MPALTRGCGRSFAATFICPVAFRGQKGSHIKMRKQLNDEANTKLSCVIPLHKKTLAVGTLKSILNQANISVDEFIENL